MACTQENGELTIEERETIVLEEVQDQQEEPEEPEENSTNDNIESTSDSSNQNIGSNVEKFDSLPMDIQIALLTPYYDERGEPQGIIDGAYFIQVHSGAGIGRPVFMIERQGDTFHPVDGVTNMGASGYKITHPPQVSVTVDELMTDYESNPDLYDEAATNHYPDKFELASFNKLKKMAEESDSQ